MAIDLTVKLTDKLFFDSPDPGAGCLCSRCRKPIMDSAIRIWPSEISEYRFHEECLQMAADHPIPRPENNWSDES